MGQDPDTRRRYAALETWSRESFPIRSIDYQWSAHDYMPADNGPDIGWLLAGSNRIHVATGFKQWGMTTGTLEREPERGQAFCRQSTRYTGCATVEELALGEGTIVSVDGE